MAEERIEFPVTPERTKADIGNLRRHSTGKKSTSNSGEKILPHYLRASTSSCHDFCKYGRKHAFEAKARHPIPKRIIATPAEGQDSVKGATQAEIKKKAMVKLKPSPGSKTQFPDKTKIIKLPDKPKIIKLPDRSKIIKREVPSPAKKVVISTTQASLAGEKRVVSAKRSTDLKPKPVAVKPTPSPLNPSGDLSGRKNSDVKKKVLVPPRTSLSPKPSVNRVTSLNARKNLKVVSPLKNQNRIRKAEPKQPTENEVREKTLYVIEPNTVNKSLEPAQNGTLTVQSSPSSSSSHKSSSPSISPSLLSQEEEEHELSEFTLSEADDSFSELDETENENQIETSKVEDNRGARRAAMIHPEDKDCLPHKLNFRRGKVVDLQSENNGPRRLRFRQGRVLGENQNGKGGTGRRSFRRRREVVDGDSNDTSEKVVLRHQDVHGKKDAQGLFNNVIEETASKLVETRKSKVKALVGAFETVISLQESNSTS
ncbi:hypothetical protein HHK36_007311 [Tetracentron sinense]|uniref:Calmodulin-binding domain-containing protein n=1 Tax=Tetracentron sinense TaxID=13715 RepID=A0A835DPT6_TETSI|nr:hypothetical protein HHK36_007311 [Tetracentron sinense]